MSIKRIANNMHAVAVTAIRKVNGMTATEQMKALFKKRDNLVHEQRQLDAAINDARRAWADEHGLLMLPHIDVIRAQVMA